MATEQDLLAARLEDSIKLSRKRPCFLGFLDEAQAAFCQERLSRRQDVAYLSWGGHEYAERVVLGFFPDYLEPAPEYFPITPLVLSYRKEDKLTHRDFLGSFMALGVERSVIGDIVVGEGQCVGGDGGVFPPQHPKKRPGGGKALPPVGRYAARRPAVRGAQRRGGL